MSSNALAPSIGISPDSILQGLSALWVSGILSAGVRLNLFGALADGAKNATALGAAIGAPERSTRMLCDALSALGYLAKSDDGYANTEVTGAFLDPAKPTFVGGMTHIFNSPMMWSEFGRMADVVKHGGTLMDRNALTPDHEFWHVFAENTLAMAIPNAHAIAEALPELGIAPPLRILDIACGTGGYGITLAQRFPGSSITFADWPTVLDRTAVNAGRFGVGDQCEYKPGDLFTTDYGSDYDLVVLANIHHHFNEADCIRINQVAKKALKPGGAAVVVDFIPEEGRVGNPMPLMFALVMLMWTPEGDTRTESEYRRTFEAAGFARFDPRPTPSPQRLLFAR